jgi:hypothetical protein
MRLTRRRENLPVALDPEDHVTAASALTACSPQIPSGRRTTRGEQPKIERVFEAGCPYAQQTQRVRRLMTDLLLSRVEP